jgi:purine-cytosine permease-like protein
VPERERHGRVNDRGPLWLHCDFHCFAIAIGFVGPSPGLSLGYTALAGTLGILIGTAFQAFHASQGAEMGLPQMIQSRAQFGYGGVIVPLVGTLVSLLGNNIVSTVLVSEGMQALWGLVRQLVALGISLLAAVAIAALMATIGMSAYSAMLAFLTTAHSIRPVRPTCGVRVMVILASMVVCIGVAVSFGGHAVT